MSATLASRQYKAIFILDTRGYEQPVENLVEELKGHLTAVGATLEKVENMGRKDFIRTPSRKHTGDFYVEVHFAGAPSLPGAIKERLRLERTIKRAHIESA